MNIKFPNINDYLTIEEISQYLKIKPKAWKSKKILSVVPPALQCDGAVCYKWGDILALINRQSRKKTRNRPSKKTVSERNSKIIERYEEINNEIMRLNVPTSLLSIAKSLVKEFNISVMTIYGVINNHKKNMDNKTNSAPIINLECKTNKFSDYLKEEQTTLPANRLFGKIYSMMLIGNKIKNEKNN